MHGRKLVFQLSVKAKCLMIAEAFTVCKAILACGGYFNKEENAKASAKSKL